MSMHLVGPYMTTTQYSRKKRKKLPTEKQLQAQAAHEKYLRKLGYTPPAERKGKQESPYKAPDYKQHQGTYTLGNNLVGSTAKRKENVYTGDELAGIGMLHKSNMVPVRKDSDDAKEIARMRRG